MFRFVVLLAATFAVAHTQTWLYPSNYRQVSWQSPIQSQIPLTHQLQFVPYNPISTIYRYPTTQYQYHFVPLPQRQLIEPSTFTHTRTLPYVWGQSGRSFSSDVPSTQVAQSGFVGGQPLVGGEQYAGVRQPLVGGEQYAGVRQPYTGAQPQFVGQQQSVVGQQGVQYQSAGHVAVQGAQQIQPAHGKSQLVGYVPGGAIVATPVGEHHQGSHVAGQVPVTTSTHGHGISSPVSYSVPNQPLASTSQISQYPTSQGTYIGQAVGHQESVGHHQVSQVTLPGQVGVGGGYTSAAFYESSPSAAGVVIPSVPLSSEPIVASDVKVASKAGQNTVQPHVTGHHHQTVGVQAF